MKILIKGYCDGKVREEEIFGDFRSDFIQGGVLYAVILEEIGESHTLMKKSEWDKYDNFGKYLNDKIIPKRQTQDDREGNGGHLNSKEKIEIENQVKFCPQCGEKMKRWKVVVGSGEGTSYYSCSECDKKRVGPPLSVHLSDEEIKSLSDDRTREEWIEFLKERSEEEG